ncbi:MAG: hypothetical protein JWQ38_1687 [Flavipsychrobacter sp.]|nr:hypothetical protein [Flavipsychrobacter sp.]
MFLYLYAGIHSFFVHLRSAGNNRWLLVLLIGALSSHSYAQITPAEGSRLNYRIIGFSFPAGQSVPGYNLEIAEGNWNNSVDFRAHASIKIASKKNRLIAEVPAFGKQYTWRVVYNSPATASQLYHFTTDTLRAASTDRARVIVKSNSNKYPHSYILMGSCNTMFDMNGNPVWFLPADSIHGLDMKVSPTGTLTFINGGDAYEVNYAGKKLWTADNKTDTAVDSASGFDFHHEFTKLSHGRYFGLVTRKFNDKPLPVIGEKRLRFFPPFDNTSIAELDSNGNITWAWDCTEYIHRSDVNKLLLRYPKLRIETHENACFFNEKDSIIYLGTSGISRIVKIKYPSGKVLNEYGNKYVAPSSASDSSAESLMKEFQQLANGSQFCFQHTLQHSADGFLYIYDNNRTSDKLKPRQTPAVLKMKESHGHLEKIWDFDCAHVIENTGKQGNGGGGNIVLLPDNSVFVSTNNPYNYLFIINDKKAILWKAIAEQYDPATGEWKPRATYRASIITQQQLEQLIWHK